MSAKSIEKFIMYIKRRDGEINDENIKEILSQQDITHISSIRRIFDLTRGDVDSKIIADFIYDNIYSILGNPVILTIKPKNADDIISRVIYRKYSEDTGEIVNRLTKDNFFKISLYCIKGDVRRWLIPHVTLNKLVVSELFTETDELLRNILSEYILFKEYYIEDLDDLALQLKHFKADFIKVKKIKMMKLEIDKENGIITEFEYKKYLMEIFI